MIWYCRNDWLNSEQDMNDPALLIDSSKVEKKNDFI